MRVVSLSMSPKPPTTTPLLPAQHPCPVLDDTGRWPSRAVAAPNTQQQPALSRSVPHSVRPAPPRRAPLHRRDTRQLARTPRADTDSTRPETSARSRLFTATCNRIRAAGMAGCRAARFLRGAARKRATIKPPATAAKSRRFTAAAVRHPNDPMFMSRL